MRGNKGYFMTLQIRSFSFDLRDFCPGPVHPSTLRKKAENRGGSVSHMTLSDKERNKEEKSYFCDAVKLYQTSLSDKKGLG